MEIWCKMDYKSAKYVLFVCHNLQNGNLTQVTSRSFLGSWELLGIFKSLFVFTLENQAMASAPFNPPLKTQRQRRGMQNVNGQTAPAPLERGRDEGARPGRPLFCYIAKQGQKWNSTHSVQGVRLCTLLNGSSRADPGLWTKARAAKQKAWKYKSWQNEWDRF